MQTTLFGRTEAPGFDERFANARRLELDERGAWLDRVQGWITGHEALMKRLSERLTWHQQRRSMYERVVDVPRLLASVPRDGDEPLLHAMAGALSRRYRIEFDAISLALYRDGQDSVAWHRDKYICDWPRAFVAVASLGGNRRFMVRPLGGGPSRTVTTGWGDLLVMGGTTQRRWEHAIPKERHAEPRMALMFRHSARPSAGRLVRSRGTSSSRTG